MSKSTAEKAHAFRDLHASGTFVMPNAWDAGSAKLLAAAGYSALGTTSAGINYSQGRPDGAGGVGREAMLEACRAIAAAVDLPVSGDLEGGYGDRPEAVAATVRESATCGMVGGSIEDATGDPTAPLYDRDLAVERICAAREAADATGIAYTLTARSEPYLVGHENPFEEALVRVRRYHEAGADCLYVPGLKDPETIGRLVREVDGPINVVMGLAGRPLTVAQLADLGVRRISTGGSLARAAFGTLRAAAREVAADGSFGYASTAIPDAELSGFFEDLQ